MEHKVHIGREDALRKLDGYFDLVRKTRKGALVCIHGESGAGKTSLVEKFAANCKARVESLFVAETVCQSPVGSLQVGEIQALFPFRRVFEQLSDAAQGGAKKKLYMNMGMTVLAVLPLIGDVFYGIKEFRRDIREYKKEKGDGKDGESDAQTELIREFVEALRKVTADNDILILLEDFHYADIQSVQLLSALAQQISEMRALFVVSYRESEINQNTHPLRPVLEQALAAGSIAEKIELLPFRQEDVARFALAVIPDYSGSPELEEWILQHSGGMPSIVAEYLKYFSVHNPFNADGGLSERFRDEEFIPTTVNSLFAAILEQLSEEDRVLLSLCAVEGRECTVFVITRLLNSDVLTTVRRLRSLQNRTGMLRSTGPQLRYGVKTTIYEFTQALYHKLFLQSLEFEEQTTIHAQIVEILKHEMDDAVSEGQKELIAPYLAAHSNGAGDDKVARSMLLQAARSADKYESTEIMERLFTEFMTHEPFAANDQDVLEQKEFMALINNRKHEFLANSDDLDSVEESVAEIGVESFATIRSAIVERFLHGEYAVAMRIHRRYADSAEEGFETLNRVELNTLMARCYTEAGRYDDAESFARAASEEASAALLPTWECLALNALAILLQRQGRLREAEETIRKAGQLSLELVKEFQMLTSANIAGLLHEQDPDEARRHRDAASTLAAELDLKRFAKEITAP